LWESAYAELVFTKRMWPDFDEADLAAAVDEFRARERRFGALARAAGPNTASAPASASAEPKQAVDRVSPATSLEPLHALELTNRREQPHS
jgi:hypothetical protein